MGDIYGSNLNNRLAPGVPPKPTFRQYAQREIKTWWCAACNIAIRQVKDPVTCDACGGDVTIAPLRVREQMERKA